MTLFFENFDTRRVFLSIILARDGLFCLESALETATITFLHFYNFTSGSLLRDPESGLEMAHVLENLD